MRNTPVKQWRKQKEVSSVIGKNGEILQWTIIRVPTTPFMTQAPYPVIIVKMQDGEKMIGQMVDWQDSDLKLGRSVEAVLRRAYTHDQEGVILYTIKFKPLP